MAEGDSPGGRHPLRLGKYPVTGVLGEGAMGTVYRAHDPVIQRDVAIKTIRKDLMDSDMGATEIAARFRNEARAVGRLSHPGIVSIYEYGEDETTAFIAMEFVEGRNLSQILHGTPVLAEPVVLRLMTQLLDALACAHEQGVWHRDIKPANLIVTTAGQLKVTDFGIARIASAALTQVGSAIGTPGYMAPEQYVGELIDHRVDLFAAGVLLYRLLTGVLPFRGAPEQVMYKILSEEPLPPSQVEHAIGGQRYDAIVAMALAKDPARRFPSAASFKLALTQGLAAAVAAGHDSDATVIVTPRAATAQASQPSQVQQATLPDSSSRGTTTAGLAALASLAGSGPPNDAMIEAARLVLTTHIGPISRIIMKRVLAAQPSRDQLALAITQQAGDGVNRDKLLAELVKAIG